MFTLKENCYNFVSFWFSWFDSNEQILGNKLALLTMEVEFLFKDLFPCSHTHELQVKERLQNSITWPVKLHYTAVNPNLVPNLSFWLSSRFNFYSVINILQNLSLQSDEMAWNLSQYASCHTGGVERLGERSVVCGSRSGECLWCDVRGRSVCPSTLKAKYRFLYRIILNIMV